MIYIVSGIGLVWSLLGDLHLRSPLLREHLQLKKGPHLLLVHLRNLPFRHRANDEELEEGETSEGVGTKERRAARRCKNEDGGALERKDI